MPKAKKTTPTQTSTRPRRTTTTKQAAGVASKPIKSKERPSKINKEEIEEGNGQGFKDSSTAQTTISNISHRSLTHQYQTISTLYNRARNHPHKTADIEAAIKVFKEWIDVTYPAAKNGLRGDGGFKPLLSKDVVLKYLPLLKKKLNKTEVRFADLYVTLGKGKRIGNNLLDEKIESSNDWESERYKVLDTLIPVGKEEKSGWTDDELWDGKEPTVEHMRLIAWAWSPVPGRTLASK
jgi:hypothetical protein